MQMFTMAQEVPCMRVISDAQLMMMMMVLTIMMVDSMTIRVVGMVVMMMVIFVKGVNYLQM